MDRQTLLGNLAYALKFLETHGNHQTKLWKVLAKYHNLPDHFYDLKTTLQTEFDVLKAATSKNVQNLLDTVQQHQTYTTALGEQITTLHNKLAQLEKQVQVHCLYPHHLTDEVQL